MRKHTPGPWKARILREKVLIENDDGDGRKIIAEVFGNTNLDCNDNSILIAAAPEMLEALIEIQNRLNKTEKGFINLGIPSICKKAISKARGEK